MTVGPTNKCKSFEEFSRGIAEYAKKEKVNPQALEAFLFKNKDLIKINRDKDVAATLFHMIGKFDPESKGLERIIKQTQKIAGLLYPELLPEMEREVLSHLPPEALLNETVVISKKTAEEVFLKKCVIGKEQWAVHFPQVEITDTPPLPKDIIEILKAPCPFWPDKKVYQSHRLVLVPAGLSINSIGTLMGPKINGKESAYNYTSREVVEKLGNNPTEKSHWVLMTTDVIPGSRNKTFEKQVLLIQERSSEYEMPSAVDAIVVPLMNFVCSGEKQERLLPQIPTTYTYCKKKIDKLPLAIGCFAPRGLDVLHISVDCHDSTGVLAARKFCATL